MLIIFFSGQLNECSHRLEKLQQDLVRYQGYLDEVIKGIQSGNFGNAYGFFYSLS